MKNILVPTDFSACASSATKVALQLAAAFNAQLHLYSNLDISEDAPIYNEEDKRTIHNAELLMAEWSQQAKEQSIVMETAWSAGKLNESIADYVNDNQIDFVVMGSHGISGKSEFFIGSNTQKVVRTLHTPVLIVKDDIVNFGFNKVVFASNFNLSDVEPFQYLIDLIKPFNPEIHLVQVNTSGWFGEPYLLVKEVMNDFKKMCGTLTCETHFFRDWTVEGGIRHLSEKIGADLIAISNQKRHPLKRMFVGSNVEALVNHAEMPVLSIDLKGLKDKDLEGGVAGQNASTSTEPKYEL